MINEFYFLLIILIYLLVSHTSSYCQRICFLKTSYLSSYCRRNHIFFRQSKTLPKIGNEWLGEQVEEQGAYKKKAIENMLNWFLAISTLKLEVVLNTFDMDLMVQKLSTEGSIRIKVSSGYWRWRWEITKPDAPILNPNKQLSSTIFKPYHITKFFHKPEGKGKGLPRPIYLNLPYSWRDV